MLRNRRWPSILATIIVLSEVISAAVIYRSHGALERGEIGKHDVPSTISIRNHEDGPSRMFEAQVKNPKEVLSVLLLIGGDIIQKAIAQLAGPTKVTPVAFSFGWVGYTFNSLMDAFGDGTYLPRPDYPGTVVVVNSRDTRKNQAWVLGRLIRDLELKVNSGLRRWKDQDGRYTDQNSEGHSGLLVTVFETHSGHRGNLFTDCGPKRPMKDKLWWAFCPVTIVQLIIASIPWIKSRNWSILLMTACGSLLSLVTGSLRVLFQEKFGCREHSNLMYAITRGNGHRHVFLILPDALNKGDSSALFLDDLATAVHHSGWQSRTISVLLATLWIGFLVIAIGIDSDTWYLLGVGALGMLHNVFVAGWHRSPEAHGIPLRSPVEDPERLHLQVEFGRRKRDASRPRVMDVLLELEEKYPGAGLALLKLFFTGTLRENEISKWGDMEATLRVRTKDWEAKRYPRHFNESSKCH